MSAVSWPFRREGAIQMVHFVALFCLVALIEWIHAIESGAGPLAALGTLPPDVYEWVPVIAGVSVLIPRPDRAGVRAGLGIALFSGLLMVVLDLAATAIVSGPLAAVAGDRIVVVRHRPFSPDHGIPLALRWIAGSVPGAAERLAEYPAEHPRVAVTESLRGLGQLLLVFAIVGIVLGASRWFAKHVRFDNPANEWGAHVVAGWLIGGIVAALVAMGANRLRYTVLFDGAPLGTLIVPYALALLAGAFGFWYASRTGAALRAVAREGPTPHEPD